MAPTNIMNTLTPKPKFSPRKMNKPVQFPKPKIAKKVTIKKK